MEKELHLGHFGMNSNHHSGDSEILNSIHNMLVDLGREVSALSTEIEALTLDVRKVEEIVRYTHDDVLELKIQRDMRKSIFNWVSEYGWGIAVGIAGIGAVVIPLLMKHR